VLKPVKTKEQEVPIRSLQSFLQSPHVDSMGPLLLGWNVEQYANVLLHEASVMIFVSSCAEKSEITWAFQSFVKTHTSDSKRGFLRSPGPGEDKGLGWTLKQFQILGAYIRSDNNGLVESANQKQVNRSVLIHKRLFCVVTIFEWAAVLLNKISHRLIGWKRSISSILLAKSEKRYSTTGRWGCRSGS